MNADLFNRIETAADFIRAQGVAEVFPTALLFGSGLGAIARGMQVEKALPYAEIPGFAPTTLSFHNGRLLFGKVAGKPVVAMDGRLHCYEGYTMAQVAFPVRVMKRLGAERLLLTNISGGLNPEFHTGDIVVITDHINLMGGNPLVGPNDDRLGPRFPDMSQPYSRRLIEITERVALDLRMLLKRGVYAGLLGPSFETRAEYRMLRVLGADLVGMSSIPEVITAVHARMEVLGLSLVTDECFPECLKPLEVPEVLKVAEQGASQLAALIGAVIAHPEFD